MGRKRASRREEEVEDDSDEDEQHDSEEEAEGPPKKFVVPGDTTGNGIDYCILEEDSWLTLQAYCEVRRFYLPEIRGVLLYRERYAQV